MTVVQSQGFQSAGAVADRVIETLVAGLEIEFGRGADAALAALYLEAEECDFVWEARIAERWLGAYQTGDDGEDFDRIAVIGQLQGGWFIAQIIIDGEGQAQGLLGRRNYESETAARDAWAGMG
jgi:hypothetical protein